MRGVLYRMTFPGGKAYVARIGIKFSDEHRAKLSAARKGKIVHLWSDESRKKASESRKRMLANKVAEKCQ